MLEKFEQSLEYLDEAGITSIEVLQSRVAIEEIQAIGNDSDSSISYSEEYSPETDRPESLEGSESSGNASEADDSEEDDLEEDLELEIQQNQLVMVNWILTHRYLIVPLKFLLGRFRRRVLGCLEGCLGAWGKVFGCFGGLDFRKLIHRLSIDGGVPGTNCE